MPIPETRQLRLDAGGLIKAPIGTRKAVYESTQEMTVVVEDQEIGFRGGATLFLQHTCRTVGSNTTGCPAALGTGVTRLYHPAAFVRGRCGPAAYALAAQYIQKISNVSYNRDKGFRDIGTSLK